MPKPVQPKAAVLFISGQSNAHAHGQFLPEADRILTPMKNVFSLDRNPNQSHFCKTHDISPDAEDKIAAALRQQIERHPGVQMVDAADCPLWDESSPRRGIFAKDEAHYLPEVQKWFADRFYGEVRNRYHFI